MSSRSASKSPFKNASKPSRIKAALSVLIGRVSRWNESGLSVTRRWYLGPAHRGKFESLGRAVVRQHDIGRLGGSDGVGPPRWRDGEAGGAREPVGGADVSADCGRGSRRAAVRASEKM